MALDDPDGSFLIGADHFTQVFRVQLASKFARVGQVTEHDGQLPAFRFSRAGSSACPGPDEATAGLLGDLRVRVEDFLFEVLKVGIIEVELPFERPVADSASVLEDVDGLLERLFKGHRRSSRG